MRTPPSPPTVPAAGRTAAGWAAFFVCLLVPMGKDHKMCRGQEYPAGKETHHPAAHGTHGSHGGGGGVAAQSCTIISQCKSASAPSVPC